MKPALVFGVVFGYFLLLIAVAWLTSRKADVTDFFNANKKSPWFLVAFGMVGATLSGVTFISVPGEVGNSSWSYLQFALGNVVGYWVVAAVLLPLYYRLNLISIYGFLEQRLGMGAYKTGAFFFLISKLVGAAFRLYLVAAVLQLAFFDAFGIPFYLTVIITIALIWVYTFRGGIKTIVWTDTLQTVFLLSAVVFTIVAIAHSLNMDLGEMVKAVATDRRSDIFVWDWRSKGHFVKQFLAGVFVTVVIVGMDQDMMQKNLTCKSRREAQKNMLVFSGAFIVTVLLFLSLGVLLYRFAEAHSIALPQKSDDLYPLLALKYLGLPVGIAFLLGITAAAYSSADSALTAMTTSFCIDFMRIERYPQQQRERVKRWVHLAFSVLLVGVIVSFHVLNDQSIVMAVFTAVGYTYGPILGLFLYALYRPRRLKSAWVPVVAVLAPVISYCLAQNSAAWLGGYKFGFELLIVNGLFTFAGLFLLEEKHVAEN